MSWVDDDGRTVVLASAASAWRKRAEQANERVDKLGAAGDELIRAYLEGTVDDMVRAIKAWRVVREDTAA